MKCENCKEQDYCDIYQEWLNTRDCYCPYAVKEREEYCKKRGLGYVGDQNAPIKIKEDTFKEDYGKALEETINCGSTRYTSDDNPLTPKTIKKAIKILEKHKLKPDKDGLVEVEFPVYRTDFFTGALPQALIDKIDNPLYRDSVGGEEMGE